MRRIYRLLFFFTLMLSKAIAYSEDLHFDPQQVAREETAAWKDYYDNDVTGLVQHLSHLIIVEFRLNQLTAWETVIPQLTLAATTFKGLPHSTSQEVYKSSVLPHLTKAYQGIRDAWHAHWDPEQAAQDELDWWIYRRQQPTLDPEIVGKKIADLYLLLYGTHDHNHFIRAGYLRAVSARYRDVCQRLWSHVEDVDWTIIENMLLQSYKELLTGIQLNEKTK